MRVPIAIISNVRSHGDTLTIVSVIDNGEQYEVVANLEPDGSSRWKIGDLCVYVPENAIVPQDVLEERGYWEPGAKKGMLGGSKGNRVSMRRFAGFESRGLLFKVDAPILHLGDGTIARTNTPNVGEIHQSVSIGDNVGDFFGITEYVPQ